jgi:hypothetical protein
VAIDRKAAVDYAKKFWNRVADDDKIAISSGQILLADKRRSMKAPASDGWEAFFVSNGGAGEKAVFRRTVKGTMEEMPDPIVDWDALDDCTHYVSRCLINEGISLTETGRANELAEAMIKSGQTKTLALKASQAAGQKVVDSGVFKPGDLVAYFSDKKGRYHHTAMFVGKQTTDPKDPGGITCHTVCRFEGQTKAWNGADDDAWFLHGGDSYTLIHFSEDDGGISAATLKWLPGWWNVGSDFYFVTDKGRAFSTPLKPHKATQKVLHGNSVGYYFEAGGGDVTFVWRKPRGKTQVERWTAPTETKEASLKIDGTAAGLTRVF